MSWHIDEVAQRLCGTDEPRLVFQIGHHDADVDSRVRQKQANLGRNPARQIIVCVEKYKDQSAIRELGLQLPAAELYSPANLGALRDFRPRNAQRTRDNYVVLMEKFRPDARNQSANRLDFAVPFDDREDGQAAHWAAVPVENNSS
jgi:hypothetical protein